MDCTHLHPFLSVLTSSHPLLQLILMRFTTKGFPTIYKSISHWSHPPNLSVVLLTHLNLWMSPVKYSLRQISMTYLHHTKIPRANIRHA